MRKLAVLLFAGLLALGVAPVQADDDVYIEWLGQSFPQEQLDAQVYTTDGPTTKEFGLKPLRRDLGLTGAGITVCVVDTGVDTTHEQLDTQLVGSANFTDERSDKDLHGHGTHVSGIILGDGTGSKKAGRMRGVAPKARLLAAKVLTQRGSGQVSWVISGIEWCVDQGADIINMSLSTMDDNPALNAATNKALSAGVLPVVAAGNSGNYPGFMGSPARATGALTVGAMADWKGKDMGPWLAPFSSRGDQFGFVKPDIVGPGVTVVSASSNFGTHPAIVTPGGYHSWSGTSMATPFVAGVAALLMQQGATAQQAKDTLMSTALDLGKPGCDNNWGCGIIDPGKALGGTPTAFPPHETWSVGGGPAQDYYKWLRLTTEGAHVKHVAATILMDGNQDDSLSWPQYSAHIYAVDSRGTVDFSLCPHVKFSGEWCGKGAVAAQQTLAGLAKDLSDVMFPLDNGDHVFAMNPSTMGDPDESYWNRPWSATVDFFYA